MKYTSLFSAVAIVAAMSTQALASATPVAGDDFESYAIPDEAAAIAVKDIQNFSTKGWMVNTDLDLSEIVATHFQEGGQALRLNTNGQELGFVAETTRDYLATVSMKVEMKASDTMVDMSNDSQSHTALFLLSEDVEGSEDKVCTLKAFSYDPNLGEYGDNTWVTLEAENFSIADGDVANITIAIDYQQEIATYTVNGTTFPAIPLANPNTYIQSKKLTSVAFKGTGYVDDLFVTEEAAGIFATFIDETTIPAYSEQKRLDGQSFSWSAIVDEKEGYISGGAYFSREGDVDTKIADAVLDDFGNWELTSAEGFVEGGTYVFKAIYTVKDAVILIQSEDEEQIDVINTKWFASFVWEAPEGATWDAYVIDGDEGFDDVPTIGSIESDYIVITLYGYSGGEAEPAIWTADQVFGSITWTAFDPVAGTATFEWTAAEAYNFAEGDEFGSFQVVVSTELGGETTLAGTVTVDGDAFTGSVSGLPTEGDALFLLGLADAPAADEE